PIAGTESVSAGSLFWSPDSRFIGFGLQQHLKRVDASNGVIDEICALPTGGFRGAAWSRHGIILLAIGGAGMMSVPASGGTPALVLPQSGIPTAAPTFLPDDAHFLYTRFQLSPADRGIFVGSVNDPPDRQRRDAVVSGVASALCASA